MYNNFTTHMNEIEKNAENLPIKTEPDIQAVSKQITQEEIQHDFDYYMAQHIAEKLKAEGLITVDEFTASRAPRMLANISSSLLALPPPRTSMGA